MLLALVVVSTCSWQTALAEDVVASVTLKETNSLNSEILALSNVEDVKTVTHLTVTTQEGVQLGGEDWTTLQSMGALVELDLSNASAESVPYRQFYWTTCIILAKVKLPKDLKTIGASAFESKTNLVTVEVPNTVTTIGSSAFKGCAMLENCDLSGCAISTLPSDIFNGCAKLSSFAIPSTVTSIGNRAFEGCSSFTSALPAGIKEIGQDAFNGAAMENVDVVIPEGMEIMSDVFRKSKIKSIVFPTTYIKYVSTFYYGCSNLQEVTFKSPTVVNAGSSSVAAIAGNVKLIVPSHLVASYKAHPHWSKYKDVVAISPAVADYTVSADLNLSNSSMRMEGTPSLFFNVDASLTISGDAAQAFNNFTSSANLSNQGSTSTRINGTKIFNETADVTVSGDFKQRFKTRERRWHALCLPFDFKVGDVTAESGSFVIRKYDGERRNTQNTSSGNWSANLSADEVITAGTGFILQTSEETWVTIKANGGTNHAFKKNTDEIKIALAANNTNTEATAANTGWNMVGNPWQTFFSIRKMNYTAPFAVFSTYNTTSGKYTTYSPEDDDYALEPFQAMFVQCPNGVTSVDFPANGRQMTSVVTSPATTRAARNRQLFDIQVASGELTDKTRLVVNGNAAMDYEIGRDASKFFADGTDVPQIYSLDVDGTQYAINERPENNGTLKLGIIFATDGEYTLSAIRNDIGQVILTDHETGIKTDLQKNAYTFEAEAGVNNSRFSISFGGGVTGISTARTAEAAAKEVYTLDGIKLGNTTDGLQRGVYVVRQGNTTQKVIIR